MNTTQKRLAKEYLLFLGCNGISILFFLGLTTFYLVTRDNLDKISRTIVNRKINKKQFFEDFNKNSSRNINRFSYYPFWNRMDELLEKDSIQSRWNNKWKETGVTDIFVNMGISTSDTLIRFLNDNSTSELEEQRSRIVKLSSIYNRWTYSWEFLLFILVIVFPFRYLLLSFKFSLNCLKK